MLKTTKTNEQKGFTIIEVLIVLAVAALILLVVFLAVPGLQRNQKNTQIKQEISRLSGAIVNFEANNGGAAPLNSSDLTTVLADSNIGSSSLIYTSNQYVTAPYVTSSAQTLYLLSTGTASYNTAYTFGGQKNLTFCWSAPIKGAVFLTAENSIPWLLPGCRGLTTPISCWDSGRWITGLSCTPMDMTRCSTIFRLHINLRRQARSGPVQIRPPAHL